MRKTTDTTARNGYGSHKCYFIFLHYYPFYLFPSTSTSIFAGPKAWCILNPWEVWALSHHILIKQACCTCPFTIKTGQNNIKRPQVQHLDYTFCPHWITTDPLYTPDDQIQFTLTKCWFFFLPLFFPQPCSLIKHPQITISGILRLSMFFSSCGDIVHFLPYLALHVPNWVMFWLTPSGQEGNWRQSLRMGYMLTCMSEASPPTSRKVGLLALNTEWAISPALRVQGNLGVQSL